MSTATQVSVTAPIIGLRLHARRAPGGTVSAVKVKELLDLGERERHRLAAEAAVTALAQTVQRTLALIPDQVAAAIADVAAQAVELGLAIAREIVGTALDRGFVDPTPTVARCLRDCVHGSTKADLVVRLHTADLALVQERLARLPELAEQVATARFVADAAVPRGGVRAETGAGRLLYDPREALARVSEEVRREVSG